MAAKSKSATMTAPALTDHQESDALGLPPEAPEAPVEGTEQCPPVAPEAPETSGEAPAPTAPEETRPTKLAGDDLVQYANDRKGKGLTAEELAFGAGYARREKETGKLVPSPDAYSKALGIALGFIPAPAKREAGTRTLSHKLKSNPTTGNTVVTGAYLRELGVEPGTSFNIIVDKEANELILQPVKPEAGEASK